jgi:hypothetical protein
MTKFTNNLFTLAIILITLLLFTLGINYFSKDVFKSGETKTIKVSL